MTRGQLLPIDDARALLDRVGTIYLMVDLVEGGDPAEFPASREDAREWLDGLDDRCVVYTRLVEEDSALYLGREPNCRY